MELRKEVLIPLWDNNFPLDVLERHRAHQAHPVDVQAVLAPADVQAVLAPVDVQAVLAPVDVQAVLAPVDVQAVLAPVDVQAVLAPVDVQAYFCSVLPPPDTLHFLIGDDLGKLKWGIPNGYQMKTFVLMGSKVYSYRLIHTQSSDEKIVTKFKGVVSSTAKVINMTTMESSIREFLEGNTEIISASDRTMRRSKVMGDITTTPSIKKLRPVMDKVRVLSDGKTLPCGYYPDCQLFDDTLVFSSIYFSNIHNFTFIHPAIK